MDETTVKFGTPEPIGFREFSKARPEIDLDLEARIVGQSVVSDFDETVYTDADAAGLKITQSAALIIKDCFDGWDHDISIRSEGSKTEILSFTLTPESQSLFEGAIKQYLDLKNGVYGWDHLDFGPYAENNEGQPRYNESPTAPGIGGLPWYMNPDSDDVMADVKLTPEMMKCKTAAPNGKGDKFCRQCGEKRAEGSRFCTGCGAKFE